MGCELCGKDSELVRASIEGLEMSVCRNCARFGKKVAAPKAPPQPVRRVARPVQTKVEAVVQDCAALVKQAREARAMKQEELAKQLQEKASVIQNIESGRLTPPIALARKLERFLNIRLVEVVEEEEVKRAQSSSGLTIGDVLKL